MSLIQIPAVWSAPQRERTLAGDVITTRRARFNSQEDQIGFLRELVDEFRGHAGIRARARDIVFREYNCTPRNEVQYAIALGTWVQQNITYVRELPEEFASPTTTLLTRYGDCDDFATVTAALCESLGIESELVGMSWATPTGPRQADGTLAMVDGFGHIFTRAVVNGMRVPLDATLEFPIDQLTDPIELGRQRRLPRLRVLVA